MFVCHQVQSMVKWSVAGKGKQIKKTRSSYSLALVFMGELRQVRVLSVSVSLSMSVSACCCFKVPHSADCDLWQLAARPSSFCWRMGRPPTVEFEPVCRGWAASLASLTCRSRWPHYHLANYLSMMMPCAVLRSALLCPALLWSALCRLAVISFICGNASIYLHFISISNLIIFQQINMWAWPLRSNETTKGNVCIYIHIYYIHTDNGEELLMSFSIVKSRTKTWQTAEKLFGFTLL